MRHFKLSIPPPVFYFLAFLFLVSSGCRQKNAYPETFFVPKGRVGSVKIYYAQHNGQEKKYLGNRRLYHIPLEGSLSTQFTADYGWLDQEYYYVDSIGNIKLILFDSSQLYVEKPELAAKFKTLHPTDTLIMQWGISGKVGDKRYQEFVIGTYQIPNSIDTTFFDDED